MGWESGIEPQPWNVGDELPLHNEACMVCGTRSGSSPLVTPFQVIDDGVVGARVRFDDRHQGAPHYAHGGAVAAALDDACGYVGYLVVRMFVTARLEVDYRRPVLLGTEYELRAWCERVEGRKVYLAAELLEGEQPIAEAKGLFIVVEIDHFRP
jgi:uncharacterized protein (TIGR00369 family)